MMGASSNSLKIAHHLLDKIVKAQSVFDSASAGQYYCSGSCYQVSCASVALLESAFKPTIALSSEAQTLVPLSGTFVLAYGVPLAFWGCHHFKFSMHHCTYNAA